MNLKNFIKIFLKKHFINSDLCNFCLINKKNKKIILFLNFLKNYMFDIAIQKK